MNDYYEIYKQRLNRNGQTPSERLEKGRERNFNNFLHQSPHYEKFMYKDQEIECVFEPVKQDPDESIMHVLTSVKNHFEPGDICTIAGLRYLFWYWNERQDSGYNKWTVIKVSQEINWTDIDRNSYKNEAYLRGKSASAVANRLQSQSKKATLYFENENLDFIIMPLDKHMTLGSYLTLKIKEVSRGYEVVGIDFISTPGVMYVSLNPTMERENPDANIHSDDKNDLWLGGVLNG